MISSLGCFTHCSELYYPSTPQDFSTFLFHCSPQADLFLHSILLYPLKSQDNPQAHSQAPSGSFFYFLLPFLFLVSLIFPLSSIFSLSLLNFLPSPPTLSFSLIAFSFPSTLPFPIRPGDRHEVPPPYFFPPPKEMEKMPRRPGSFVFGWGFPSVSMFT